jgi:hypothetical protein
VTGPFQRFPARSGESSVAGQTSERFRGNALTIHDRLVASVAGTVPSGSIDINVNITDQSELSGFPNVPIVLAEGVGICVKDDPEPVRAPDGSR